MPKCNTCRKLRRDPIWCAYINDSPCVDFERECDDYRRMTNADKIRAMSDEELADLFYSFQNLEDEVKFCKNKGVCDDILDDGNDIPDAMCKQCLVEWLQSEVEEVNNPEPSEPAQPSWKENMLRIFTGRRQ